MQSQIELTEEQKGLRQFLENYDSVELEPQILDLQKEGFTFEFINSTWRLSRVYYNLFKISIGVNNLEKSSQLKLVLAHEIAHVYEILEGKREESIINREVNAWKKALAILNLTEDIEAIEFSQNCINNYLKDNSEYLCNCPSCKEKREVK